MSQGTLPANTVISTGLKVPISEALLRPLPANERALMLGMWHAANELSALRKMILVANNAEAHGPLEEAGRAMNSWMLIKLFATKSYEAWNFFKTAQSRLDFRTIYLSSPDGPNLQESKDWLGKYFGKNSLLEAVRKIAGAHYDHSVISNSANDLEGLDSFVYIAKHNGNVLYWAAEEVAIRGIQREIAPNEELSVLTDRIVEDVDLVARKLVDLAQLIGVIAMKRALDGNALPSSSLEQISARRSRSLELPFFIDFSEEAGEPITSASLDRNRSSARPG